MRFALPRSCGNLSQTSRLRSLAAPLSTRHQSTLQQAPASLSIPLFVPSQMKLATPQLVITDRAKLDLPTLTPPLFTVGVVGQSRSGKSAFFDALAAYIYEQEHGHDVAAKAVYFKSSSSEDPVTKGIDFLTLPLRQGTLILMDCEGIDDYDAGLSAPLSAMNMAFSKVLFVMSRQRGEYISDLLPKLVTYPGEKRADVLYFGTITDLYVTKTRFESVFKKPEMVKVDQQFISKELFKLRVGLNIPDFDGDDDTVLALRDAEIHRQLREGLTAKIRRFDIWHKLQSEIAPITVDNVQLNGEGFLDFIETTAEGYNKSGVLQVTVQSKNLWFEDQEQFPKEIAFEAYKASMRWSETAPIIIPETKLELAHQENKASALLEFEDRVDNHPDVVRNKVKASLARQIDEHYEKIKKDNTKKVILPPDELVGSVSTALLGNRTVHEVIFNPDVKKQLEPLVCDYSTRLGVDGAYIRGYAKEAAGSISSGVVEKFTTKVLGPNLSKGSVHGGSPSDYRVNDSMTIQFGDITGSAKMKNISFDSYNGEVLSRSGGATVKFDVSKSETEKYEFKLDAKGELGKDGGKVTGGGSGTYGFSKTESNSLNQTYSFNWAVSDTQVAVFTADLVLDLTLKRTLDPALWSKILSFGITTAFIKSNNKSVTVNGSIKVFVPINDTTVQYTQN